MFRIYIILLMICFMPSIVMAQVTCDQQPMGKINVVWSSSPIKYDFSKSQSEMDRIENDTVNPYDRNVKTHVGGLMQGGIALQSRIQVATLNYPRAKQICQWIDHMQISIKIDPKILIARDHKKGSCRHNAILEHEMKHVFVDRDIVKKYVPKIRRILEDGVRKVGVVGPKKSSEAKKFQQKINDYMEGELKKITDQMYEERTKRQAQVDTLKEYERVAAMCR